MRFNRTEQSDGCRRVSYPIIAALTVRLDREALSDRRAGRATVTRMGRDRGFRPAEARSR
jgi:hypothetical protein